MRRTIFFILIVVIASCKVVAQPQFNLGFEKLTSPSFISDGWFKWGDYTVMVDSLCYSGMKSGKIVNTSNGHFGSIVYKIPANYSGDIIEVGGFMRIKDVENGYAGLLVRIDGNGRTLAFDNMHRQNISGSREWAKYSIRLTYPEQAENIFVGGILTGTGEAWFDDITVFIDGKNIDTLKQITPPPHSVAPFDAQFANGSKIDSIRITSETIDDIALLGKVWGFLKYYHPSIAQGNYNWDYELFRILPAYCNKKTVIEKEKVLLSWIESLGEVNKCETCDSTRSEVFIRPESDWINKSVVLVALNKKLRYIYDNRNQGKNYYVKIVPGIGNPEFRNENSYSTMTYPDAGYRLLALFRYWNAINYFYPHKYLIDKNWSSTLNDYIPKFVHAHNELEYEQAVVQIIGDIQDTHANLWYGGDKIEEWKGNYFAPVHLTFIENKFVVTDYYNPDIKLETGLEIGDVITKVDGQDVYEICRSMSKYYPASNDASRFRDISADLLRSRYSEMEIEYLHDSEYVSKRISLYSRGELDTLKWSPKRPEKCYKLLENNIGYVNLGTITENDISKIKDEFENTRGIIIDIRNYPSAFVPFKLGSFFVSSTTPFVKFSTGNTDNPGEFAFTRTLKIPKSDRTFSGKLVVLVNEVTQSQAEYTAMAFRAGDNTTIVGSTTAGADGNVSEIVLPGGLRTRISGIGVYYPDRNETQKVGIVPDIEVHPTVKGIKEGRDELLEAAIDVILEKKKIKE